MDKSCTKHERRQKTNFVTGKKEASGKLQTTLGPKTNIKSEKGSTTIL